MMRELKIDLWLHRAQGISLAAVPVLTAHSAFYVLGFVPTRFSIIFELRGIVFKLADLALMVLLTATILRLILSGSYRRQIGTTAMLCRRYAAGWALSGLTLWIFAGVLWADQPFLTVYHAVMTSLLLAMGLILVDRVRLHRPVGIIAAFALAAAFQAGITVLQHWNGGSLGWTWLGEVPFTGERGQGLTFNPNTLADFLVIGHFMAICWLVMVAAAPMKRAALLMLLIINAGIFATLSRGALGAVWLSTIVLFILLKTRQHRYKNWLRLGGMLLVGMIFIILIVNLRFNREQNLAQRLFFAFPLTAAVIQESPFLGVGAGNLMLRADTIASSGQISVVEHLVYGQLQPAHNAYLTLWAELGLPGVLLTVLIGWQIVADLLTSSSKLQLVIGCTLLAVGIIMASEFHFWLDVQWRRLLFWIIAVSLGNELTRFTKNPPDLAATSGFLQT